MDLIVWILLAVAYILLAIFVGFTALNKGHTILFFAGLFFPLLWIVGAMLAPTNAAQTDQARARLR